jgi:hypothetical protein
MAARPMTTRRWTLVIAIAAVDFTVLAQCEGPSGLIDLIGMLLLIRNIPMMLLWIMFSRDETD